MESKLGVSAEENKEKLPTGFFFVPVESIDSSEKATENTDRKKKYFQKILEKVEGSKEKELLLFSAIAVELFNAWIEKFNVNKVKSMSALDEVEKFLDWYCQSSEARTKATAIVAYPFSDAVRFSAVLLLGKLGFVVREGSTEKYMHKQVRKIVDLQEFLTWDSSDLFVESKIHESSAAH